LRGLTQMAWGPTPTPGPTDAAPSATRACAVLLKWRGAPPPRLAQLTPRPQHSRLRALTQMARGPTPTPGPTDAAPSATRACALGFGQSVSVIRSPSSVVRRPSPVVRSP
jgi:hypothetical protein